MKNVFFQVLQFLFGTFFAPMNSTYNNLQNSLKNWVFCTFELKNDICANFMFIFVFSVSKHLSIRNFNKIRSMGFAEVYPS